MTDMGKNTDFTASGDEGYTGLIGPGRYSKSDLRFEVLGTLDECSAVLGMARAMIPDQDIREVITVVQRDLYQIMGEISDNSHFNGTQSRVVSPLPENRVDWLEKVIEEYGKEMKSPGGFVFSGDFPEEAILNMARTITRRAERRLVQWGQGEETDHLIARKYMNRLSSLLFRLELVLRERKGVPPQIMAFRKSES